MSCLPFGGDGAHRDAEDEREDHQLQHVAVERADGGLDRVARDELDERIGDRLGAGRLRLKRLDALDVCAAWSESETRRLA